MAEEIRNDEHLIGLIAHELCSPATVISGYLQLVLRHAAVHLTPRELAMIEDANASCGHLLHLVDELGELAGLERNGTLPLTSAVPIFALCEEVVRTTAVELAARLTFSCAKTDRSASVRGNSDQLIHAVHALAAAALRGSGTGRLEAHGFVSRDRERAQAIVALGPPGIARRPTLGLLNRQLRFDRWRGGTGMSLVIACRIVEGHGGAIWSLPNPAHAACAFSLPLGGS